MKKLFMIILIVLLAVGIGGIVAMNIFLNSAIKKGVETFGPKVTQTSVTVEKVKVSPITGYGELQGFVIGNPQGFNTASAFRLGKVVFHINLKSLLSDKIIIHEITIDNPEVTYELALSGSNIDRIKESIEALPGGNDGPSQKPEKKAADESNKPGKKIQIDSFLFQGAKINLSAKILQGEVLTIPLPKIQLSDIGGDSDDGSNLSEVADEIFSSLHKAIIDTVKSTGKLGDVLGEPADKIGAAAKEGVSKVFGGIKGLLKQK